MDPAACLAELAELDPCLSYGKVTKVVGMIVEGRGVKAPLGAV